MSIDPQIKHLFDLAVEISDPQMRAQFLEIACAGDHKLQARLEELLHHDAAENNPLDVPLVPSILNRSSRIQPGTQIGPYKIREQIGEGGFGEVYVAEQTQPIRRKVALKLIKFGMDSKDIVGRFQAERQALAMMDHPHVAKVLDAGATDEGRPYFVMELVRGVSITRFCNLRKLSLRERLELFTDTCHAVQHAHQKGIIHRDLKPSNILVSVRDDKPVVKVIDFGVAKALSQPLTELTVYTAFGQMIGTPMYMSPEQAQLNEVDVDTRSDVYTLGVLLYELLTGIPPFDRETLEKAGFDEMRRIIREDEPLKPSSRLSTLQMQDISTIADQRNVELHKLSRTLQGELDWIVMQALEKDRNRRYESPKEFADDIDRYLTGQAVQACPPSVTYRLRKFTKRHRRKLTSVALLLIALCAFGAWEFLQSRWHYKQVEAVLVQLREEKEASDRANQLAQQEAARAEQEAQNALRAATRARKTSYISGMKLAFQRIEEGRLMEASQILADQIPTKGEPDLRHAEWYYLDAKLKSKFRVIGTHSAGVEDLELFPDGQRVVSAGMDGVLMIWDLVDGTPLYRRKLHDRAIHAVAVSPNGRWIAYGEEDYPHDSRVVIIDAESGVELGRLNSFPYTIRSLDFSSDGKYLVSASAGSAAVDVWEFQNGLSGKLHHLTNAMGHVCTSDDGNTLLVPQLRSKQFSLWDLKSQTVIRQVKSLRDTNPSSCGFSSSRQLAAFAFQKLKQGNDLRTLIDLFDVASGKRLAELNCHAWERVIFTPDGTSLIVGSHSGWLEVWDISQPLSEIEPENIIDGHSRLRVINGTVKPILAIDSNSVLVAGSDGVIALCHIRTEEAVTDLKSEDLRVTNIAASPDSTLLALFSIDNRVRLTDYASGKLLATSEEMPHFARTLVFSPCGTLLAAQCDNEVLHCWNISQRTLKSLGTRHLGKTSSADQVAIDRQHVIGFGEEPDCCYLLETNNIAGVPLLLREMFSELVLLSPDGRTLVTGYSNLRIFRRNDLTLLHNIPEVGTTYDLAISSDNRWLACANRDGSIHLRDLATGELRYRLTGHHHTLRAMAFSEDSSRLISGDGAGRIGFWDVESGDLYGLSDEFNKKEQWIRKICFGPDELWLDVTAGAAIPDRWTKRIPLRSVTSH